MAGREAKTVVVPSVQFDGAPTREDLKVELSTEDGNEFKVRLLRDATGGEVVLVTEFETWASSLWRLAMELEQLTVDKVASTGELRDTD